MVIHFSLEGEWKRCGRHNAISFIYFIFFLFVSFVCFFFLLFLFCSKTNRFACHCGDPQGWCVYQICISLYFWLAYLMSQTITVFMRYAINIWTIHCSEYRYIQYLCIDSNYVWFIIYDLIQTLTLEYLYLKHKKKKMAEKYITVLTTSLRMAALSGLVAFMSRLLIWRNSPSCSINSFSCSRRRFSLLHLFICDCGYSVLAMTNEPTQTHTRPSREHANKMPMLIAKFNFHCM